MHVLQIGKYLPPVPGGMETAVFELSRGLSKIPNLHVSCLVTNTGPKTVREKIDNIEIIRAASYGTLASTPISFAFGREGRKIQADLLHFHLPNPLATAAFGDVKQPYVITYHCDIVRYRKLLKLYEPTMKRFLAGAKRIIVSSAALIESSPHLRDFKNKCVVIPFAIDPEAYALTPERKILRDKLIEQFGQRVILFVGRLVSYKGLNDLITAMKDVDGKLVIVGTGPEAESLRNLTQTLGLSEKVHFAGFVTSENLPAYYHATKLVALTSINSSEAFGMCLLEGLACGKPLVTTKLPTGVKSVNVDGVTGFQVAISDTQEIAAKITTILNDKTLRESMEGHALEHFRKNFLVDAMTEAHLKIYREALSK